MLEVEGFCFTVVGLGGFVKLRKGILLPPLPDTLCLLMLVIKLLAGVAMLLAMLRLVLLLLAWSCTHNTVAAS